ncbi:hypothetical protein MN608_01082 [Microdochium nivale]|nr:hypothetical protein MN608_01082 [Microdochium nivale]
MAGKIQAMYSPFRPQPRKSARTVVIWVAVLILVLWMAYHLRHDKEARLANAGRMREHRKGVRFQDE